MRPIGGIRVRLRPAPARGSSAGGGGDGGECRAGGDGGDGDGADGGDDRGSSTAVEGELMLSGVGSLTPGYWKLDGSCSCTQRSCSAAQPASSSSSPPSSSLSADAGGEVEWATGDLVERRVGGSLRHVCRRDELLLHTSGEMTNPVAAEGVILPLLRDACASSSASAASASAASASATSASAASASASRRGEPAPAATRLGWRVADCCVFGAKGSGASP